MKSKVNCALKALLSVLIIVIGLGTSVVQADSDPNTDPIVPIEIVQKGRSAVFAELGRQVDHVVIELTGDSVPSQVKRYISREHLLSLGYVHAGSFKELSDAINNVVFNVEILPSPKVKGGRGGYDVQLKEVFYTSDNRVCLTANGWGDVHDDGEHLTVLFTPYIMMGECILQSVEYGTEGKWVAGNWNSNPETLNGVYDQNQHYFLQIPTRLLGEGMLQELTAKGAIGYNLSNGAVVHGRELMAWIGQHQSSDLELVSDPTKIGKDWWGYESYGRVYARVPLTDLNLQPGMTYIIDPLIKVGSSNIRPSRAFARIVNSNSSQEFELDWTEKGGGGWIIWGDTTSMREYQIRWDFDEVYDWNADPNPQG